MPWRSWRREAGAAASVGPRKGPAPTSGRARPHRTEVLGERGSPQYGEIRSITTSFLQFLREPPRRPCLGLSTSRLHFFMLIAGPEGAAACSRQRGRRVRPQPARWSGARGPVVRNFACAAGMRDSPQRVEDVALRFSRPCPICYVCSMPWPGEVLHLGRQGRPVTYLVLGDRRVGSSGQGVRRPRTTAWAVSRTTGYRSLDRSRRFRRRDPGSARCRKDGAG